MQSFNRDSFLILVCLGIGHYVFFLLVDVDWKEIRTLAYQHGLSVVVIGGIDNFSTYLQSL